MQKKILTYEKISGSMKKNRVYANKRERVFFLFIAPTLSNGMFRYILKIK